MSPCPSSWGLLPRRLVDADPATKGLPVGRSDSRIIRPSGTMPSCAQRIRASTSMKSVPARAASRAAALESSGQLRPHCRSGHGGWPGRRRGRKRIGMGANDRGTLGKSARPQTVPSRPQSRSTVPPRDRAARARGVFLTPSSSDDRGAVGRGPGHDLGRGRFGQGAVDRPGGAHEGRAGASRAVDPRGHGASARCRAWRGAPTSSSRHRAGCCLT